MNRRSFIIRLGVLIGSMYLPLPKPVETNGALTPEALEAAFDYFADLPPEPTILLFPEDVAKLLREFYTPGVVNHIKAMSQ